MILSKKNIFIILLGFICFIISSSFSFLFFHYKMNWVGTIILCLSIFLFESVIFLGISGIPVALLKIKNINDQNKINNDISTIRVVYYFIAFLMIFLLFPFSFVKSYQMAQVMIFSCGVISPLIFLICMLGFRKSAGFSVPIFKFIKLWHLAILIYIFIAIVSIKIAEYNPAFFRVNYRLHITKSNLENISVNNVLMLKFSYQTIMPDEYIMHLSVKSDKKLFFGKFGHGMVYGNMSFDKSKKLILDVYDDDVDDGDPAVTFNTDTGEFTFRNKNNEFIIAFAE